MSTILTGNEVREARAWKENFEEAGGAIVYVPRIGITVAVLPTGNGQAHFTVAVRGFGEDTDSKKIGLYMVMERWQNRETLPLAVSRADSMMDVALTLASTFVTLA